MVDVMFPEDGLRDVLKRIHDFYLQEIAFWVSTDVDGISFTIPAAVSWRSLS